MDWPEPIVRVQSISESGSAVIPDRYVKPLSHRPSTPAVAADPTLSIPVVDLGGGGPSAASSDAVVRQVSAACRDWGFFQVVNHGVDPELMRRARETWRQFFHLPMADKERHSNSPATYEGYGSRLGVEKGASLDWGDYYYLHLLPLRLKDPRKWPELPEAMAGVIEEYGEGLSGLCWDVLAAMSAGLGVRSGRLAEAFGGEGGAGVCVRTNYYPPCPQPELALGLSAHSDPGGVTVLLVDDRVRGLQVRRGGGWITVDPAPDAFIVNVGDQIQVLSNAIYKSVEHRVVVNSAAERLSIAFFYNPRSDLPVGPIDELVSPDRPALYEPMTFDEYRMAIRKAGPRGKELADESLEPKK